MRLGSQLVFTLAATQRCDCPGEKPEAKTISSVGETIPPCQPKRPGVVEPKGMGGEVEFTEVDILLTWILVGYRQ